MMCQIEERTVKVVMVHPTEKPGRADLPLLWGELSATPRSSCPFSVFHTAPG